MRRPQGSRQSRQGFDFRKDERIAFAAGWTAEAKPRMKKFEVEVEVEISGRGNGQVISKFPERV